MPLEDALVQHPRQANPAHVSPAGPGVHQGGSAFEAAVEEMAPFLQQTGSMLHRFGAPRGWQSAPTHRYVLDREIAPRFCRLLRLRYEQTWRLPRDQELEQLFEVPDEGRQAAGHFWHIPPVDGATLQTTSFRVHDDDKEYFGSPTVSLWEDKPRYQGGRAWILLDESTEDSGLRIRNAFVQRATIEETMATPAVSLFKVRYKRLRSAHTEIVRMGECQCVPAEEIPPSTAVSLWTARLFEDNLPQLFE